MNLSLFDELYFISKLCALDDNERARETAEQCDHRRPRLDLPAPACAFLITREGRKH